MKMYIYRIYKIKSNGSHEIIDRVAANNGKSALKKFQKTLLSTGMYEIYCIKPGKWELSSTYGEYWYAEKEKI